MSINSKDRKVGVIISHYLLTVILVAFFVMLAGYIVAQTVVLRIYSFSLTEEYVDDFCKEVEESTKNYYAEYAQNAEKLLENEWEKYSVQQVLSDLVYHNIESFKEINIVDKDGIVICSSVLDHEGFDMYSNEFTAESMRVFEGEEPYVQDMGISAFDGKTRMKYVCVPFSTGDMMMHMGINEETYFAVRNANIHERISNKHIGRRGYAIVCDRDRNVLGYTEGSFEGDVFELTELLPDEDSEYHKTKSAALGQMSYIVSRVTPEYYFIGVYPVVETRRSEVINTLLTITMFIIVLICIFVSLSHLMRHHVVEDIEDINRSLLTITEGNLTKKVESYGSLEFCELSDGINKTVDKLKDMIDEADERVRQEMEFAKVIQTSAVPNVFPPFPDKGSFGLYAMMDTAKAVGGDFYDFFMVSDDTLALVIADVSDKGMPAALFMMKAKTLIKAYAEEGLSVEEAAAKANHDLCEGNTAGMFVTAWLGFMNINTGLIGYVHAGHTKPVLCSAGKVEYVSQKKNLMLGGMPEAPYIRQELKLSPGDCLFLYTDGVTEAKSADGELYGESRLSNLLDNNIGQIGTVDSNQYAESVCRLVYEDVKSFAEGTEQSDDITMLAVRYSPLYMA